MIVAIHYPCEAIGVWLAAAAAAVATVACMALEPCRERNYVAAICDHVLFLHPGG